MRSVIYFNYLRKKKDMKKLYLFSVLMFMSIMFFGQIDVNIDSIGTISWSDTTRMGSFEVVVKNLGPDTSNWRGVQFYLSSDKDEEYDSLDVNLGYRYRET
jgi:hypothetical protein